MSRSPHSSDGEEEAFADYQPRREVPLRRAGSSASASSGSALVPAPESLMEMMARLSSEAKARERDNPPQPPQPVQLDEFDDAERLRYS